ncbi:CST complex subunit Ten1 [Delphinella strobiligena]|nr:CST complex subunit Ten1 [Delphinella strobiligena]
MNVKSPLPSTILFVSQLQGRSQGDKVRFLGCVEHYDKKNGTLVLLHHYPKRWKTAPKVIVDVNPLLDTVKFHDLEVGAWTNVIGYISPQSQTGARILPCVQAVMIWSAGIINLDEYESALAARQKTGS